MNIGRTLALGVFIIPRYARYYMHRKVNQVQLLVIKFTADHRFYVTAFLAATLYAISIINISRGRVQPLSHGEFLTQSAI